MSLLTSLANASLVGGAASSGASGPVLSASRPIVEEGDEVQFMLYAPGGVEGTTYAYSITGITADDLFYGTLTGNFTLDSLGNAQVSIILATDSVPEIETITMTVSSLNLSVQVAITDTSPAPVGEIVYDTAGSYQWVCPAGVTKVSAVAIGPGGSGAQVYYNQTSTRPISGAGGGLGWKNNIAVTPGQTYTVRVGTSGTLDSFFISTSTVRGGYGKNGSIYPSVAAAGGTYTGDGGGNGGSSPITFYDATISGAGGVGGWNSSGGSGGYYNGTSTSIRSGLSSTNGGGGGASGYFSYAPGYSNDYGGRGGKGGGNHLFGITSSPTSAGGVWAGSSSGGNNGASGGSYSSGVFGGGGFSAGYVYSYSAAQLAGGSGAVRIMWGEGRSFPYNADYVAPSVGGTSVTLHQTLNNPNAYGTSDGDGFGISVGISGNYAIVGAQGEDDAGGTTSGKVYIFNVTTGALLHTLDNPNPVGTSASDYFGHSVKISGNYAIVGAHQEDDANNSGAGKAYIFDITTGTLLHTLDNPNAYGTSASDYFGWAVAISGNYAIATAYGEDDGTNGGLSGKAYIFDVTTGALLHTLDNPNAYGTSESDVFGWSVAISGNYAIVGAYQEGDSNLDTNAPGGTSSGKAYIFDVTTGALVHTLDNPNAYDTSNLDGFGYSVSISGNYAIVGASYEDDAGGLGSGKAYIFDVTTGALLHTIDNPNAYGTSDGDRFGDECEISGQYAIVSAYLEEDAGGDTSGKAYIFDVTTGALLHTLDNPNPVGTSANDYFGGAVAISGNYAIVGASSEDDADGGINSGKAYIYRLDQT